MFSAITRRAFLDVIGAAAAAPVDGSLRDAAFLFERPY